MELSRVYGGAVVLLLVVALLAVLRRCWRRRRRAVCWFCHEPQPGGSREAGWSCVSCHQYNGFTEDGGYDREMTEQYTADPPLRRYCTSSTSALAPPPSVAAGLLCSQCEQNLQLKVSQLAAFQPTSEARFEEEATEYERSVEKLYPLCALCEQNVANEISLRNHMIRPLLLNAKPTTPQKRKASFGQQMCSWGFKLLHWSSFAVSLWSLVSVLPHCQEKPCSLQSGLLRHCCGLSSYMLSSARRLCPPLDNTASLLRETSAGSTLPVTGVFGTMDTSHDQSHDFLRDQRNGTCRARRKVDLLYEYVLKPKEYCYMTIFCRGLHWLAGPASSSHSLEASALTLVVLDTALSINRRQRKLHLCLLLLDAAVLCLLSHACSQLLTMWKAISCRRLGAVLVGASTALRIAAPLVGHCSSRRQWNKHVLRTPQKRREERARVRVQLEESSSWAIQNSLGSLSIGQVVNGSGQKSWLRSLEEMNLLSPVPGAPGNHDAASCTGNSSGSGFNTIPFTHEKPHPPDGGRKPLLRPARFRYRRFSINSATAALSLSGSNPRSAGMEQELLLPLSGSNPRSGGMEQELLLPLSGSNPQSAGMEQELLLPLSGSNPRSGGMEQELLLSLTESQPHKTTHPVARPLSSGLSTAEGSVPSDPETWATMTVRKPAGRRRAGQWCPWVVTVVLVTSITSNVVLLTCLLLHMYPPYT